MWGLLTSVNFAVVQIIVLSLFAVVGMTLRQLPGFAFRSSTDYANEMAKLHSQYDPVLGTGVVDALERLQLWHVFSSTWFSIGLVVLILSIVACTLDRTPAAVAPERGHPGRAAGPVLRPQAARPGVDVRRRGAPTSPPSSAATASWSEARWPTGRRTSTATATAG